MKLILQRADYSKHSTIGTLALDGRVLCFTLEDVVRVGPKVFGETAIPAGSYTVVLDLSQRFGKVMPHVLDVPGFQGIRIHPGNTDKDTHGCILVGLSKRADFIGESKAAYAMLLLKIEAAIAAGEVVTLDVCDAALERVA